MPQIFLDCDGVLADFDRAARELLGMCPRRYEDKFGGKAFWDAIYRHGQFFSTLPLMADAKDLYDGVKHLEPVILTGCPRGDWSQRQKAQWIEENFPGVPKIMCRSVDKRDHGKPGDVLIDDWPQHRPRWLEMGGIWISHTSAEESLSMLWTIYPELKGN